MDPATNSEPILAPPSTGTGKTAEADVLPLAHKKFTDPPPMDHPMPAWVIDRTMRKNKKETQLRLPSRPAFAPPPRGMETHITRPSPHTLHMFTPRAIEHATHPTHETRNAKTLALKKPIVSYRHAPVRPAIGKELRPFPFKVGQEKYLKPTSPRLTSGEGNKDEETKQEADLIPSAATVAAAKSPLSKSSRRQAAATATATATATTATTSTMSLESVDGADLNTKTTPLGEGGNVDDPQYLRIDLSKLPLELFDSTVYETRPPEAWLTSLETGENTGTTTGKSMYWVGGEWIWRSCDVLSYDLEDARYTIRFRGSQRLKKVRRINLRFDHENHELFEKRVFAAQSAREECKARLRLQHYMQDMPVENVSPVRSEILKSICRRIAMPQVTGGAKRGIPRSKEKDRKIKLYGSSSSGEQKKDTATSSSFLNDIENNVMLSADETSALLTNMLVDVRGEYVDAVKFAQLNYMLHVLDDESLRDECQRLRLPTLEKKIIVPPMFGKCVQLPPFSFEQRARRVSNSLYIFDPHVARCFMWLHNEWELHFKDYRLFSIDAFDGMEFPCEINAFYEAHDRHCKRITRELETKWRNGFMEMMLDRAVDAFDFFEQDEKVYSNSRTKRLLRSLNLRMADQLRYLLEQSIYDMETYLAKRGISLHTETTTATVTTERGDESVNMTSTGTTGMASSPLFLIQLTVSNDRVVFEPTTNVVRDTIIQIMNDMVVQLRSFATIDCKMMTLIRLHEGPLLPLLLPSESMPVFGNDNQNVEGIKPTLLHYDTPEVLQAARDLVQSPAAREIETFIQSMRDHTVNTVELLVVEPNALAKKFQDMEGVLDVNADKTANELAEYLIQSRAPKDGVEDAEEEGDGEGEDNNDNSEDNQETGRGGGGAVQADEEEGEEEGEAMSESEKEAAIILKEIQSRVDAAYAVTQEVRSLSDGEVDFPLCRVRIVRAREFLAEHAQSVTSALLECIVTDSRKLSIDIIAEFQDIETKIADIPTNEDELAKLQRLMESSPGTVERLCNDLSLMHHRLSVVSTYQHNQSWDDFKGSWETWLWPAKIEEALSFRAQDLKNEHEKMMNDLDKERTKFEKQVKALMPRVKAFQKYGDIEQIVTLCDEAVQLDEDISFAKETAQDINVREITLGLGDTPFPPLEEAERLFSPHLRMWTTLSDFRRSKVDWLEGPFESLVAQEVSDEVQNTFDVAFKLRKDLSTFNGPATVATALFEEVKTFQSDVPLIVALASPALRHRHWVDIANKCGSDDFIVDEETTLNTLIAKGIKEHLDTIQGVATVAEKQFSLEKALEAMRTEWAGISFECVEYTRASAFIDLAMLDAEENQEPNADGTAPTNALQGSKLTYIVRGVDDIIALLDDHIVKIQTMRASPFIRPIDQRARAWERKLNYLQSLIDEWMATQRAWLYLHPVFGSEDIMQQLPQESRKFALVDSFWMKTMDETNVVPSVMEIAGNDRLLSKFKTANDRLAKIEKGLNEYLELKRSYFPRFYFLSAEELLKILSQTKNPLAVQPFLGKCFEGCNKVRFDDGKEEQMAIVSMVSSEQEEVKLERCIQPNKGVLRGCVEKWLSLLEMTMCDTIRLITSRAVKAYAKDVQPGDGSRERFALNWPGMVVLSVTQIFWTQDVTRAIREGGTKAVKEYGKQLSKQLEAIVYLVRGDLTKLQRKCLGALTTMDVHARDTTATMVTAGIESDTQFEWMRELRYYW